MGSNNFEQLVKHVLQLYVHRRYFELPFIHISLAWKMVSVMGVDTRSKGHVRLKVMAPNESMNTTSYTCTFILCILTFDKGQNDDIK